MLIELLEKRGIPSLCTAHPDVLPTALSQPAVPRLLIESTCNQVNQFGGYTGMTPQDFVDYVTGLAREENFPLDRVILGGDHLGPNVWQNEPAELAMHKSVDLVQAYVRAGYRKIHIDCSMRLRDDPPGPLSPRTIAERATQLIQAAEGVANRPLEYVVGTEVPVPGGATEHEESVSVTKVPDVEETISLHKNALESRGLTSIWQNVLAVVVQPGVEFGDDFVFHYNSDAAEKLSDFIRTQSIHYEAHSTDYQTLDALGSLVRDGFRILKVGPELTFAYREAMFSLSRMEEELLPEGQRADLIQALDQAMLADPQYWGKYYTGDEDQRRFKRKYSLSDRIRYYWSKPEVSQAAEKLMHNLTQAAMPLPLISQFMPIELEYCEANEMPLTPINLMRARVLRVLERYNFACGL